MCLTTRKQFKSFGVNASCLSTGKQFKSCGVNASCFRPQGSSLKVVVSMHHVFSTRKYLKSCGVNASCFVNKKAV